tara:strand:+ start:363 stop:1085 length:723 start_codon:yes stop_codon:yes gene_type:complete
MYQEDIEKLIEYALVDGNVSAKDREVLFRKAFDAGIDKDEFEMVLDARIYEFNKKQHNIDNEQRKKPTQKSSKIANKCPNCQAKIDASSTTCDYCKYDIVNRQSNASIQHLFKLLNDAEEGRKSDPKGMFSSIGKVFSEAFSDITGPGKVDRKKMEIISSFPIPTTKNDILEFLALAYPKAKQIGNCFTRNSEKNKLHNQFAQVWKSKCEQIILKAKFSMKDDKETLNEVLYYGKELGIE